MVNKNYILAYTEYMSALTDDTITDELRTSFLTQCSTEENVEYDYVLSEIFYIFARKVANNDLSIEAALCTIKEEYNALPLSNVLGDFSKLEKFIETSLKAAKSSHTPLDKYMSFLSLFREHAELHDCVKYAIGLMVLRSLTISYQVAAGNMDTVKELSAIIKSYDEEPVFSQAMMDIMAYTVGPKIVL